jgi:hypothetical protein
MTNKIIIFSIILIFYHVNVAFKNIYYQILVNTKKLRRFLLFIHKKFKCAFS